MLYVCVSVHFNGVIQGGAIKKAVIYDGDRSALGIMSFIQSLVPDALQPVEE